MASVEPDAAAAAFCEFLYRSAHSLLDSLRSETRCSQNFSGDALRKYPSAFPIRSLPAS